MTLTLILLSFWLLVLRRTPLVPQHLPPAPSPPPSMVVIPPTPVIGSKPLTRRQRKAMGLPKPRAALSATTRKGSAGKIVIPGGRSKKLSGKTVESTEEVWEKNGSGRMDVRGFKELKI